MIYEVKDVNIFEFIRKNLNEFDTSNFQEDNQFNIPRVNATVVLKMKSECADIPITEFVALGAKQYAIKTVDDKTIKKAKGVKRCVVKHRISFEDYKNTLFNKTTQKRTQTTIQSKDHVLHTIKRRRIALQSNDDKRVEIEDFHTLPHGHYRLQERITMK